MWLESLGSIAAKTGINITTLLQLNPKLKPTALKPGDQVRLRDGELLAAAGAGAGEVFAVIHPHAVAIYRNRPDGTPRNVWEGTIESLDSYGERVRLRVNCAVPLVAEVTPGAVRELGLKAGAGVC